MTSIQASSERANWARSYCKAVRLPILTKAGAILLLLISARSSAGIVAEWLTNPVDGNWNDNLNWSPRVPNGPSDGAFFEVSSITDVSITANTEVAAIVFASGASAFTITASPALALPITLTISGNGTTNNSGQPQNFVTAVDSSGGAGRIIFTNSATAGSGTVFTNNGSTVSGAGGGKTEFTGTSTAGNGTFTNNGHAVSSAGGGVTEFTGTSTAGNGNFTNGADGGETEFIDGSTAGSGTFTNNGGAVSGTGGGILGFLGDSTTAGTGTFTNNGATASGATGGLTDFFGTSTAGNGTFTSNGGTVSGAGGGFIEFFVSSTAGSATLIANGGVGAGGSIQFFENSTGGTARVEVFGNGNLDISARYAPGVTIGSIEGSGNVLLGANNLTVDSNNLSKSFSGLIQDGGIHGGTGGSLTKIGTGKLSLSNPNTYTGGTTLNKGVLLVKNTSGSATGASAVQVNAGTLGGTGKIAGPVTIGTGIGTTSKANLIAGNSTTTPGTLTINNPVTFQSDSTYKCVLNRSSGKASKLTAFGVTINNSTQFAFTDTGTGTLATGTVFRVIDNTSNLPISGRFRNLSNGLILTSNDGTKFKVNYTGGTGNDLTLKVVP